MARLTQRYSPAELNRMRELFFPEERRHEFTTESWDGVSFRHYRNPKIACIEHFMPKDRPVSPGVRHAIGRRCLIVRYNLMPATGPRARR